MLDIGWNELLIIALVTILVVGPKDLPRVLRTVMQWVRKLRAMAGELQSGIDELAREAELDDIKKSIEKTASTDVAGELERSVDPTGEINKSVKEMEESVKEDPRKPRTPSPKDPDYATPFDNAPPLKSAEPAEKPATPSADAEDKPAKSAKAAKPAARKTARKAQSSASK